MALNDLVMFYGKGLDDLKTSFMIIIDFCMIWQWYVLALKMN